MQIGAEEWAIVNDGQHCSPGDLFTPLPHGECVTL